MAVPIRLFTVVVLFHGERLLLLKRAAWKSFFANRWTGIGGRVEPNELDDLEEAARRELFEETDLQPSEVSPLTLRRTLTLDRPTEGLLCILYFTGRTTSGRVPSCNEGTLHWVTPSELSALDIIDNSAGVFSRLVDDVRLGRTGVRCGIATYEPGGRLVRILFDELDQ
jgi:8-oxo-dGTP diphosphatase